MNQNLRKDAEDIARFAIEAVKPDEAVKRALADFRPEGRVFLAAVGKAAWQMAQAAVREIALYFCETGRRHPGSQWIEDQRL